MKKAVIPGVLVLILLALIPGFFLSGYIGGKVEARQIKNEIFAYVLENQEKLASNDPKDGQKFFYRVTGFSDAGVEYGYCYSEKNEYQFSGGPYGDGYLQYGRPNNGEDWYYQERICENWYYYEKHFG